MANGKWTMENISLDFLFKTLLYCIYGWSIA